VQDAWHCTRSACFGGPVTRAGIVAAFCVSSGRDDFFAAACNLLARISSLRVKAITLPRVRENLARPPLINARITARLAAVRAARKQNDDSTILGTASFDR